MNLRQLLNQDRLEITRGLDPENVSQIEMMHQRHGNRLYRIKCDTQSFVLKWFKDSTQATEVQSYALLEGFGVPTLPVYGRTENALLLEDLATSSVWRLAKEADVERWETGVAVAKWYLALHSAGRKLLSDPSKTPNFLKRWIDLLDAKSIRATGRKLGLNHSPVWTLAADYIEALKAAMHSLPETLNYNDFHWTNLALSRRHRPSLRAVVFDYHLLGIGLPYSDCRNVVGSLGNQAVSAFWETYGTVDEREQLLDKPISILYTLLVASQLPTFPSWVQDSLHEAKSGELERSLRCALEALEIL